MLSLALCALPAAGSDEYLGLPNPGRTPEVFAPGVVSNPDRHEFGSVFSADGLEIFFGVDVGGRAEIYHARFARDGWSTPQVLLADERYGFNDPFLSPDEQRLFFISNHPADADGLAEPAEASDIDIWYVERGAGGWGAPVNVGPPINSDGDEYYISFTDDGTLYFASDVADPERRGDFDVYAAAPEGDGYGQPKRLGSGVNTRSYEADAFVAYDESYLIFSSPRSGGLGRGDLWISFREGDGSWGAARHMGSEINSPGHELCPFVTKDGRYFLFTSRQDIYWVDAVVIEDFR